jgi:hypothetical protein
MWQMISTGSRGEGMAPPRHVPFDHERVLVYGTNGFDLGSTESPGYPAEQTKPTRNSLAAAFERGGELKEVVCHAPAVASDRRHVESVPLEVVEALPVRPSSTPCTNAFEPKPR